VETGRERVLEAAPEAAQAKAAAKAKERRVPAA
jgi:hypothetical protein